MLLVPAGSLVLLLVCFSIVGDALRDALDPRERPS
jgi:ABC-type dipeptide/oligopeptide/nickel transport system permease subunit